MSLIDLTQSFLLTLSIGCPPGYFLKLNHGNAHMADEGLALAESVSTNST